MAVRIRKSKTTGNERKCDSCRSNGTKLFDIGIGPQDVEPHVIRLCDHCMHTLLTKMIIVGGKGSEVR